MRLVIVIFVIFMDKEDQIQRVNNSHQICNR